jgi:hypothetical protein
VSASIPSVEPLEFRAGDTVKWTQSYADYPASQGWTLAYRFTSATDKYDINGAKVTVTGDTFNITLDAASSKVYKPGSYSWVAFVTKSGERYTVTRGHFTVLPDLANASQPIDDRTLNAKTLDSIRAMISGRTSDVVEYRIGTREVMKMNIKELLYWQGIYEARVRAEQRDRGENVRTQMIGVRFSNG